MQNLETLAALAEKLPAGVKANALALVERMGSVIEGIGDKPIPFRPDTLKLVQATSDRGKLPKGASIGSLVLGESVLGQPLKVIALRSWITRQYWNPDPEMAQMICNSPDGLVGYQYGECKVCPYSKFDATTNRSQCNKTLTYLVVTADLSSVFLINFSKTNYANGVDWQNLMRKAGVATYKRVYELGSETSKKSKNVECVKAEPVIGEKIEGEVLAFVEELFNISSQDRKESLKGYYEIVDARKAAGNNAALAGPDKDTIELISAPEEDTAIEGEIIQAGTGTPVENKKANAAKSVGENYKL